MGWQSMAPMPKGGRSGLGLTATDGAILAIGGNRGNAFVTSDVERYDPLTDSWSDAAPLEMPRRNLAVAATYDKGPKSNIFAIGGLDSGAAATGATEMYVPPSPQSKDFWVYVHPLPQPVFYGAAVGAVVNGQSKVYLFGGTNKMPSGDLWEYDVKTDVWKKLQGTTPRWRHAAVITGSTIYVLGGLNSKNQPVATVEMYDLVTHAWTQKKPMNHARYAHGATVVLQPGTGSLPFGSARIFVAGGLGAANSPLPSIESYDPKTDSWTEQWPPIITPRSDLGVCGVFSVFYTVGGHVLNVDVSLGEQFHFS